MKDYCALVSIVVLPEFFGENLSLPLLTHSKIKIQTNNENGSWRHRQMWGFGRQIFKRTSRLVHSFALNKREFWFSKCRDCSCFLFFSQLPASDPRIVNISCLPFTRAAPACNSSFTIRNQINVITAFLDGSHVYGNEVAVAKRLRACNGLMAVNQLTDKGLAFLPFSPYGLCNLTDPEHKIPCFLAGKSSSFPILTDRLINDLMPLCVE